MIWHALDRGLIHFIASIGIMMIALFFLRLLREKKRSWDWIPERCLPQLVFLAIVIPLGAFLREAYDVAVVGDPAWKSYTDLGSWALGSVLSVFLIRWSIRLEWK